MTETIDQQFVEYLVKALVGNPDKVEIKRSIDERGVLLELYVEPEDLGRVIGRNGSTAKSIRTLLRALGVKNGARYNLKIVDTGEGAQAAPAEKPAEEVKETPESKVASDAEQPAPVEKETEVAEEEKKEEDSLSRHREELKEFTDLDL